MFGILPRYFLSVIVNKCNEIYSLKVFDILGFILDNLAL